MQAPNLYPQRSNYISRSEEDSFFKAIFTVVEASLKDSSGSASTLNVPGTTSEVHEREGLVQILEAARQPDLLGYADIYKMMHDYANVALTGVTLHDRDAAVPLNFTAFEIIYRHSATTKPRVAVIPPVPHPFIVK